MKKTIIAASALLVLMTACKKPNEGELMLSPKDNYLQNIKEMSLRTFIDTRPSYEERNVLNSFQPVEASLEAKNLLQSKDFGNQILAEEKPKIRFKWSGTDPKASGCEVPIGICIILSAVDQGADLEAVNAKAINNQLVLEFPTGSASNFGLTKDGYLPILNDLTIPSDIALNLGMTQNLAVKPGIYKAVNSTLDNRFIGVALNLQ